MNGLRGYIICTSRMRTTGRGFVSIYSVYTVHRSHPPPPKRITLHLIDRPITQGPRFLVHAHFVIFCRRLLGLLISTLVVIGYIVHRPSNWCPRLRSNAARRIRVKLEWLTDIMQQADAEIVVHISVRQYNCNWLLNVAALCAAAEDPPTTTSYCGRCHDMR